MRTGVGWLVIVLGLGVACGNSTKAPPEREGSAGEPGEPGKGGTAGAAASSGGGDAGGGHAGADAQGGNPPAHTGGTDSGGEAGGENTEEGGAAGRDDVRGTAGSADPAGQGGTPTVGGSAGEAGETADGGFAGVGGAVDEPSEPVEPRLPVPCTAPLPTGYCFVSDTGDYIGAGQTTSASGSGSVQPWIGGANVVSFDLENAGNGDYWYANFAAPETTRLRPGLYESAQRYPFQPGGAPGLSIYGNGRGCNQLTGKFSIEEFATDPVEGISRFSATFEQHCEGGVPALRGVINYNATGILDATPEPDTTIQLSGKVFRVAYDRTTNIAYGLDATNRRLSKIDLDTGSTIYADVVQVPNDACVDSVRGRLFVVNKGSSLITEHRTSDLSFVRDITWSGADSDTTATRFKIHCGRDQLFVVDGAWAPALFTVSGLNGSNPVVTDHTATVAGVGGLALNAANTNLYYWYQYGWSAGSLATGVHRLLTSDFTEIDASSEAVPDFNRDPLDAPLLLDETRGLVFVKNKIFDSLNLERVVYSLPSGFDTFDGASENAFALDASRGRLATRNYVYELDRYDVLVATLNPDANQIFFAADGRLWFLSVAKGSLEAQRIRR
jgi:hypothetical protein